MTDDNDFEAALETELTQAFSPPPRTAGMPLRAPVIRAADPKERRIEAARADIDRHDAAIIAIGEKRDVEVRQREAARDQARRAFDAEERRLSREIEHIETAAAQRIELREQLKAASAATLAVLTGAKPLRGIHAHEANGENREAAWKAGAAAKASGMARREIPDEFAKWPNLAGIWMQGYDGVSP